MSHSLIICTNKWYFLIGPESNLEPIQRDSYEKALREVGEQLAPIANFGLFPTASNIAGIVLNYLNKLQGEIRSLKDQVKGLEDDLYKARSTPKDPQWVENLKWERDFLADERSELKAALEKERSNRRLEIDRLEEQVASLEVENQRLCALLAWSGENKA